jgi:hypothetical protein
MKRRKRAKPKPAPPPAPTPFGRAIEMMRERWPERTAQINDKLANDGLIEAGEFACYFCQCQNLRLKPWEAPPCHAADAAEVDDPIAYGERPGEVALRARLLRAGLSPWEPDPLAALARRRA